MEFFSSAILLLIVFFIPTLRKAFFHPGDISYTAEKKSRYLFFDFAKGIAIIAVILIHAIYLFTEKYPDYDPFWLDIINNLSRFAVGFFFISSGALLTSGISLKKLHRVFLPYIIFCIAIGVYKSSSLDLIIGGVFRGDLLVPYYFIPVLFQFYLFYPYIKKFSKSRFFLPVSLLISYAFYLLQANYVLGIPIAGQYLYLFSFGMAYSSRLKSKKAIGRFDMWLMVIFVYGALMFFFPAHYYNVRYFYAPAVLVLAHYLWTNLKQLRNFKIIQTLGRLSLWIYLVHFPIESLFMSIIQFNYGNSAYLSTLLITASTIVGSGAAALGFRLIQNEISKSY